MKNFHKITLPLILVFLIIHPARSFYGLERETGPAGKGVEGDRDIVRGIEYLYNWEFDKAEKLFRGIMREKPMDPAGYFYYSMISWSRMAAGFWTSEIVREYEERIDQTIYAAKQIIEKGNADSFTYFYLGGALGFKGRFQLMEQKWFSSYLMANEAIKALKRCLAMDPDNRDVLLGLGIYDYYMARFSGVLKFLTYVFLHRGNREAGLRKLHLAADEAVFSSLEAKSVLLYIYLFMESDFRKARPLAEELAERFRNCPRHAYLQGLTYIRLGMIPEYRKVLNTLYETGRKKGSETEVSIWENWGRYLEVSYHIFYNSYHEARSLLNEILAKRDSENNPYMIAWPLLKMGMIHDLEGRRGKALEYYDRVLWMENGAGAQFLAQRFIEEPPQKGEPLLGL
ncbi:MAG TPA: hypothetical protein ENO25_01165 [Desulfobacteraceae bacterium]|nr:hypothetical protein [Desulfobacteraceae bacterium]